MKRINGKLKHKTILIGLTGVPGTGKSLAAEYLEEMGALIISGDQTGKDIVEDIPEILPNIVSEFGNEILSPDGSLNRKSLGHIVFADNSKLEKLNSIIHPPLIELLMARIDEYRRLEITSIIVVDAALIFEWGIENWFDHILVVTADESIQLKRLMDSGLSKKDAENRIKSQISQNKKADKADFVIENNGSKAELRDKVAEFLTEIKS